MPENIIKWFSDDSCRAVISFFICLISITLFSLFTSLPVTCLTVLLGPKNWAKNSKICSMYCCQMVFIYLNRDITLPTKVHLVKAVVFPVVMYGCESWTIKKAECWRIDTFELWCWRRLLKVSWTARRSNQDLLNPKRNQSWIFIGKTDAEAETAILCPSDVKNWLIGKDPDAGKDWRWEEKGMTENGMTGWYHQLHGHESE